MANIVPFGGRQLWTSIRSRINPLFNVTPLDGPINVSYSTSTTQFIIILMKMMNIWMAGSDCWMKQFPENLACLSFLWSLFLGGDNWPLIVWRCWCLCGGGCCHRPQKSVEFWPTFHPSLAEVLVFFVANFVHFNNAEDAFSVEVVVASGYESRWGFRARFSVLYDL